MEFPPVITDYADSLLVYLSNCIFTIALDSLIGPAGIPGTR
jgi:hypothetical protein